MERLAELISKLKEQFEQNADTSKLLGTTLLIERELMKVEPVKTPAASSSKVSVVMPAPRNGYQQKAEETIVEELPEIAPPVVEEIEEPVEVKAPKQEFLFDPMKEIPTLAQQKNVKEINELIGLRDPSLNDKLKENRIEVGHVLTEHPIRDLKRAIGINDRHIFINELFRGDEVMYERSLKTINSFKIFAEAVYWIERELKVKLGWEEHKHTTQHFYQLIKRRFS
jgi:hypothetical protein